MRPFKKQGSLAPMLSASDDAFAHQCVEEVKVLQDKFQSNYLAPRSFLMVSERMTYLASKKATCLYMGAFRWRFT